MQFNSTSHIVRAEWRWVTLVSLLLLAIAFAPFLIIALRGSPQADWRFMGLLHQYHNGVVHLSQIEQGENGLWLNHLQYTPEPHASALIQPAYALLGQLASLVMLSPVTVFHIARLIAAFVMYLALYHLAASIWVKIRTRRIYFVLAAVGSGLGWLLIPLMQSVETPDLIYAQGYPFFASLINVHYPLTIACLAILVSVLIGVLRPGSDANPTVTNDGLIVVLMSLALAFLYPEALIGVFIALVGSILALMYQKLPVSREIRWLLWLVIPALPVIAYYFVTMRINPAFLTWFEQKAQSAPPPLLLLVGMGVPLLIGLPGIYRAFSRFERDGDRFMLLWFGAILAGLYVLVIRRELIVGLMLPVAYFATRAMEDVWFQYIGRRWRRRLYIVVVPLLLISNLYVLVVPVSPQLIFNTDVSGVSLEQDYIGAFRWLKTKVSSDDVILASPEDVSAWIPVWTGARVVYGDKVQTLNAEKRLNEVLSWYAASDSNQRICQQVLNQDGYRVSYVLSGVREKRLGEASCLNNLIFVASFGEVNIFATGH